MRQNKIAIEDRRKVAAACALSALGLLMLGHWIFGSESCASSLSESSPTFAAESATLARKINANRSDLDPTLRISQLELTEHGIHQGSGRNIFQSDWEDRPENSRPAPEEPRSTTGATTTVVTSAPPPIGLKFFGIATTVGSPRKVCLAQDRDIVYQSSD